MGNKKELPAMFLDDAEAHRRGANIAILLGLKPVGEKGDRFNTAWGSKTAIGLFRSVECIMNGQDA